MSDWPGGVSDGLTLPCQRCGINPLVDWQCTADAWAALNLADPLGVLCLQCYLCHGGDAAAVRQVQVIGPGVTVVFAPDFIHRYEGSGDE